VAGLPGGWAAWLRDEDVPAGTPFLISPRFEYDVELNAFFRASAYRNAPAKTTTR